MSLDRTLSEYNRELKECRDTFRAKTRDYGTAWRILRPSSLTDQLFIKAMRIRSIEEKGAQRVTDSIIEDFAGIYNYSVMALIQLSLGSSADLKMDEQRVLEFYDEQAGAIRQLMERKNHDYGEAWRDMRISSIVDMILMKLLRIKQIEDQNGETEISEGRESNFMDIANYALFSLIKLRKE